MASVLRNFSPGTVSPATTDESDWEGAWIDLGGEG